MLLNNIFLSKLILS